MNYYNISLYPTPRISHSHPIFINYSNNINYVKMLNYKNKMSNPKYCSNL